jgi:hypothetical protein
MTYQLTAQELCDAAAWVSAHVSTVHAGVLPNADITLRSLDGGGIGLRTVVMCEACERIKVSNNNFHDVTDYDAW